MRASFLIMGLSMVLASCTEISEHNGQSQQSEPVGGSGSSDQQSEPVGGSGSSDPSQQNQGGSVVSQPTQISEEELAAAEEAVYTALLCSTSTSPRVIEEDTTLGYGGASTIRSRVASEIADAQAETVESLVLRNAQSTKLRADMKLSCPYVLITSSERAEIFSDYENGWDEFHARYPGSSGISELSRVGFNQTMTQALVYMGSQSGYLSGGGACYLFKKDGSKWIQVDSVGLWIS